MSDLVTGLAGLALGAALLVFVVWLYIFLPMEMAEERGRSAGGWLLLTLITSPVFTIIALMVLGPTYEHLLAQKEEASKRSPCDG